MRSTRYAYEAWSNTRCRYEASVIPGNSRYRYEASVIPGNSRYRYEASVIPGTVIPDTGMKNYNGHRGPRGPGASVTCESRSYLHQPSQHIDNL